MKEMERLKDELEKAMKLFNGILQDVAAYDTFTPEHFRDRIHTKALIGLRPSKDKVDM